jgi:hypothetical protein
VTVSLALPVSLSQVGRPAWVGILGISAAAFLLAVPEGLDAPGISAKLAAVSPAALPPKFRSDANKLVGMITARTIPFPRRKTNAGDKKLQFDSAYLPATIIVFRCIQYSG